MTLSQTVALPLDEVVNVSLRAFRAIGFNRQEAFDTVRSLLYGALRGGKSFHGLDRFPWIARHVGDAFELGRDVSVEFSDPDLGFIRLQGHKGLGYSQIYTALLFAEAAFERCDAVHIGLLNSYPTNCIGDYAGILAGLGFCSYVGTVSPNRVSFPGSTRPKLPTSGQAFAFPGRSPLVLDFSVGAITNGDIVFCKKQGLRLPEGCCLDRDGNPTTDPDAVVDENDKFIGAILPRGGPSAGIILGGMGIVMMMHALEVGIGYGDRGTFLTARRPLPGISDSIEAFRADFADGDADLLLPGAHGAAQARLILETGVLPVGKEIWRSIADRAVDADPRDDRPDDVEEMLLQLADGTYRRLVPVTIDPFPGSHDVEKNL